MKNKPQFSVVMPVYNRQGYVHHAIQSILDQTLTDWELIIVDDASTDDTERICKSFAKKDKRITYVRNQKNRHISFSRNRGNKLAKADWIVVQDSDDMSMPDRLEAYAEYIKEHPNVDYLYSQFYIRAIDIHYGFRAVHREIHKSGEFEKERAMTVPYIPAFACCKKKTVLKHPYRLAIGYWDDWMLIMDFVMNKKEFGFIKRPIYEYVISNDSITIQSDRDGSRERDAEAIRNILRKEYGLKVS